MKFDVIILAIFFNVFPIAIKLRKQDITFFIDFINAIDQAFRLKVRILQ